MEIPQNRTQQYSREFHHSCHRPKVEAKFCSELTYLQTHSAGRATVHHCQSAIMEKLKAFLFYLKYNTNLWIQSMYFTIFTRISPKPRSRCDPVKARPPKDIRPSFVSNISQLFKLMGQWTNQIRKSGEQKAVKFVNSFFWICKWKFRN